MRDSQPSSRPARSRNTPVTLCQCVFDCFSFTSGELLLILGQETGARETPPNGLFPWAQPSLIDDEGIPIREDYRTLDDILQFSDVPRPVVASEKIRRSFTYFADSLSRLLRIALDQILNQQRDIVTPLPQCGHPHWKDIQSIEKVLAECASSHSSFQVAVRGCKHPNIDGNRLTAPHPFDLSLLEDSQQRNLRFGR